MSDAGAREAAGAASAGLVSEAAAREAAYGVFSQLVGGRLSDETLEAARLHDGLAPHLQDPRESAASLVSGLTHGAYPHAGVFLDDPPLLGGDAADARARRWAGWGLSEASFVSEPEHLATHLAALGFLCGAEADAAQDRAPTEVARMRDQQRALLDDLLLPWLPAWAVAVGPGGLCGALAGALAALVAEHRGALGPASTSVVAPPSPRAEPATEPPVPLDLAAAATSLRDVVAWLTTPARCGLLLTRAHLSEAGRALDLPRGFGDRATELTNLLRSAARFDALPRLVAALDVVAAGAAHAHAQTALAPWSSRWVTGIEATRGQLPRLLAVLGRDATE